MGLVDNEVRECFERPKTDSRIGRGGEEESWCSGWYFPICIVGTRDRGRERDAVDGSRVADKSTRGRWFVGLNNRWEGFAVNVPNANG